MNLVNSREPVEKVGDERKIVSFVAAAMFYAHNIGGTSESYMFKIYFCNLFRLVRYAESRKESNSVIVIELATGDHLAELRRQ